MIRFTNLSGSTDIGSNSYLLQWGSSRIVFDAGMHPKKEGRAAVPDYQLIGDDSPDTLFITHSHLDHIGTLPVVQSKYPDMQVVMTPATAIITDAMLHNSVNVMTAKRTQEGIVEYPFFTHREVEQLSRVWLTHPYDKPFRVGHKESVLATLCDAGHVLGSSGILLEGADDKTVLYTGDVQFDDQSLIPGANFPESGIDILIMECTHGNTHRDPAYARQKELRRLAKSIRETLENSGAVLIPVFALGKSQELLYEINQFRERGLIPNVPIYFGGLSTKLTLIYDKLCDSTPRRVPGYRLRESIKTQSFPRRGKGAITASPGNIYLVSSGMMSEHTISHQLAEQMLPRKNDSILFVGYSDPDTPAGAVKATKYGDGVATRAKSKQTYPLLCRTEQFDFSGHASRQSLVDYAVQLKPETILLVHGDPEALESMKETLESLLPATRIFIPEANQTVIIEE